MSTEERQPDPALWRPVGIGDADPSTLAYLTIDQASESEVTATVYRWPHINDSGRVELERHCALRAPPSAIRSLLSQWATNSPAESEENGYPEPR
jgi:hypothetical protein